MQLVIFVGIQATGKSTFFQEKFASSHIHLTLDMLGTRNRERILFEACLRAKQPVVIDNTNPTRTEREMYIAPALEHSFEVIGYYFRSDLKSALERNQERASNVIPEKGILNTYGKLELPNFDEGFNSLYYVNQTSGTFEVWDWRDEI